jgi:uncharacterized protein (DUF433 family)
MSKTESIIVIDPEIMCGTPCFRGTRVPFQNLLDYIEGNETLDAFLDDFPTVTREAAIEALEQAKSVLVDQLANNEARVSELGQPSHIAARL